MMFAVLFCLEVPQNVCTKRILWILGDYIDHFVGRLHQGKSCCFITNYGHQTSFFEMTAIRRSYGMLDIRSYFYVYPFSLIFTCFYNLMKILCIPHYILVCTCPLFDGLVQEYSKSRYTWEDINLLYIGLLFLLSLGPILIMDMEPIVIFETYVLPGPYLNY